MITGEIVGDIHINVYKTQSGNTFYYVEATNKDVLPELDHIEKSLHDFKAKR